MPQQEIPMLGSAELRQASNDRLAELGQALGLHPEFIADVQARGQNAIIDRAEGTDRIGSLGRVLSMLQRLGGYMQENAEQANPPMEQGAIAEAVADLADQHDMDRLTAARLVGTVLEIYSRAAQQITRGMKNESV